MSQQRYAQRWSTNTARRRTIEATLEEGRIRALREQIPSLRYSAYFNYGSHGPIPDSVLASVFNAYEQQHRLGPFSVEANIWVEEQVEAARQATAKHLQRPSEHVAFGESISSLSNAVLWGIDWRPKDHLVLSSAEHPAVITAVGNLQRRLGIHVSEWDPRGPSDVILTRLSDAFRPETRLVVFSHVLWTTGEVLPVNRIAAACHQRSNGAPVPVLVDGGQSFGVLPDPLGVSDADYFVGTFHKWLCGPDGLAILFARDPDSLQLTMAGWRSVDYNLKPHASLRKLEIGTQPYALHAGVYEAFAAHEQVGTAAQRHAGIQVRRERLRAGLDDLGKRTGAVQVITPRGEGDEPQSGILSFRLQSGGHRECCYRLEERGILVRTMQDPACIRACTHYFTSEEEIDRLLEAVDDFVHLRLERPDQTDNASGRPL